MSGDLRGLAGSFLGVSDLLSADLVLPALTARGKDEVIETLAARLAGHYPDVDRIQLRDALWERERQVSTALVDGVAIPHAKLAGLKRTVVALARSPFGIECDSHDGQPTHLFLLLVGPRDQPGEHLRMLAAASRLLHDARCRRRLMQAGAETELLAVLREEESRARRELRPA